jgi:hypothetical protein
MQRRDGSHIRGPGGLVSNQLLEDAAETHATMTALSDLGQDGPETRD